MCAQEGGGAICAQQKGGAEEGGGDYRQPEGALEGPDAKEIKDPEENRVSEGCEAEMGWREGK